MNTTNYIASIFIFLINNIFSYSQEVTKLTIDDVIDIYSLESTSAKIEHLKFKNEILEYKNYKKSYFPSVAFKVNPLNFNRSLRLLQQTNDGNYNSVEDYSNSSNTGVTISQKIGVTGGKFTLSSSINYLNEFTRNRNSFSTTPLSIGYSQKLLGFYKNYKYEKQIQSKKNQESIKRYCSSISNLQIISLELFMESLLAKLNLELSSKNKMTSDTLLNIARIKELNGIITEFEFKQVELQDANSKYEYEDALKKYNKSLYALLTFLNLNLDVNEVTISIPKYNLPKYLDSDMIYSYVEKNNPFNLSQEIKKIEAEKILYTKKLQNRLNGNINLNYGVNQHAEKFTDAYRNTNSRQSVSIGIQIPIFHWGINKNKILIARNNYKKMLLEIEKSKKEFKNRIRDQIDNYTSNTNLWIISEQTYELSKDQYKMAVKKFRMGKISVNDLISIQKEQLIAMQKYYSSIKHVWDSYFNLRHLSLYDFVKDCELSDVFIKT